MEVEIDCLYKTTNIIVMVFSENDNTSKLSIYICIAEHFLPSRTTRQLTRATDNWIYWTIDWHTTCAHIHTHCISDISLPLTPGMYIFYIWDHLLSVNNLAYFLLYYKWYCGNGGLGRKKFRAELFLKMLWTVICFHVTFYGHSWCRGLTDIRISN